jgi:hypothetical protein
MISCRRCSAAHAVSLLAGLLSFASAAIAPATDRTPMIDPEVRVAVTRGTARVLVELRVADGTRPEAELSTAEAAARQRSAIAAAQHTLVGRLVGTHFSIRRQYTMIPMIALEIGADALAVLERAGDLVARIRPDSTRRPMRWPNAPWRRNSALERGSATS